MNKWVKICLVLYHIYFYLYVITSINNCTYDKKIILPAYNHIVFYRAKLNTISTTANLMFEW